jgi:hypothetical protein
MAKVVKFPKRAPAKEKQNVRLPHFTVDTVPQIGQIIGHRGVWILAQLTKDGRQLKGTHYAMVLVGGKEPLWGVWTINGRFVQFAGSRLQLENLYPKHVWRRHPARWVFEELAPKSTVDRKNYVLMKYEGE